MFVINTPVTVNVLLRKSSNFATYASLGSFDLIVELPNKTVQYDDNITGFGSAIITTPVTATTDGELTFTYTPTLPGLHKLTLSIGAASSYTILGSTRITVMAATTATTLTATLP